MIAVSAWRFQDVDVHITLKTRIGDTAGGKKAVNGRAELREKFKIISRAKKPLGDTEGSREVKPISLA